LRDAANDSRRAENGIFRKEGEYWTIGYRNRGFRLKDTKGFAYLTHLPRHPGIEFHVLDLVGGIAAYGNEDETNQPMAGALRRDSELETAGISVTGHGDAG
jgi:hypothetical protein